MAELQEKFQVFLMKNKIPVVNLSVKSKKSEKNKALNLQFFHLLLAIKTLIWNFFSGQLGPFVIGKIWVLQKGLFLGQENCKFEKFLFNKNLVK